MLASPPIEFVWPVGQMILPRWIHPVRHFPSLRDSLRAAVQFLPELIYQKCPWLQMSYALVWLKNLDNPWEAAGEVSSERMEGKKAKQCANINKWRSGSWQHQWMLHQWIIHSFVLFNSFLKIISVQKST
jgi:hypothetical protein